MSGLNPHAGEDGGLGREEIEIIAPAIAAARAKGLDVTGPHPADTLFHEGARESYDVAICMYHDQALVPFKTLAFADGVNVTLGLPLSCAPLPITAPPSASPAPARRTRAA